MQVKALNVHTPFNSAALSSATSLLCQLTTSQACEGSGFHSRSVQLHRLLSFCCAEASTYADSTARAATSHDAGCIRSGGVSDGLCSRLSPEIDVQGMNMQQAPTITPTSHQMA